MSSDQRAPNCSPTQPTSGPPIGVDPIQATPHSDITRPRMPGVADSCNAVLASELNEMLPYPTNTSATYSRAILGASAAAVMAIPQPAAAMDNPRRLTRLRDAATSPPTTAPAPITAVIAP